MSIGNRVHLSCNVMKVSKRLQTYIYTIMGWVKIKICLAIIWPLPWLKSHFGIFFLPPAFHQRTLNHRQYDLRPNNQSGFSDEDKVLGRGWGHYQPDLQSSFITNDLASG